MKTLLTSSVFLAVALVLSSGCGKTNGSAISNTRVYVGSSAPGDSWTWTLDAAAGQFSATRDYLGTTGKSNDDYTISGSMSLLPSGFQLLQIESSTAPAPWVKSFTMTGLEVPGVALFVRATSSAGHLITAVASGNCEDSVGSYNWIKTGFSPSTMNVLSSEAYGTLGLGKGTQRTQMNLTMTGFGFANGQIFSNQLTASECVYGRMPMNQATLQVSGSNNVMSMDLGPEAGGIFGVKAVALSIAQFVGKTYLGVLATYRTTGDDSSAVRFQMNTATGTGYAFSDIQKAKLNLDYAYGLQITEIRGSEIFANLTLGSFSRTLRGVAYSKNNTTGIFLVGQELNGTAPVNLILVSQ